MRIGARVRLGALVAFAAAAALLGPAPASAGPAAPLSHEGRWITDAHGRTVILQGWNMVNKLPPYHPAAIGFGRDDARFLARHGFDTVRLGIIHKGLEPEPGTYDDAYLNRIKRTARILAREGIWVLLDFHQDMYNERFNGEGEPDWSVVGDAATLPAEPDNGFPANYLLMPAVSRAYDHFLDNAAGPGAVGLQNRFAAAWAHVVREFRGERKILGYNLFNEPWPGSQWPSCANPAGCPAADALLTSFHARVLAAIRAEDPTGLVWYAPYLLFDFGAATHHGDLGDANTGFAFNMYCLAFAGETIASGFPDLGSEEGCDAEYDFALDNAEAHQRETGDALLLTEFAATEDLPTIRTITEKADGRMIPWQQWSYFNEDPCCERATEGLVRDPALPPRGDNVKRAKLRASVRAHPRVIAGTPLGWDFDPDDGRFDLSFEAGGAGARARASGPGALSEISVPRLHYRRGYRARVDGAEVVSPPDATVLRLRNRGLAVEVVVTPVCRDRRTGTPGPDILRGTRGSDWIVGRAGADRLGGRRGRDCLYGREDDDVLAGGRGRDLVFGGSGDDVLRAGRGVDEVRGRAGADRIHSADGRRDTILCGTGVDRVRADRRDRLRGCERVRLLGQ